MASEKRKAQAKIDAAEKTLTDNVGKQESDGTRAGNPVHATGGVASPAADGRGASGARAEATGEASTQSELADEKKGRGRMGNALQGGHDRKHFAVGGGKGGRLLTPTKFVTILRPLSKVVDAVDDRRPASRPASTRSKLTFPDVDEDGKRLSAS